MENKKGRYFAPAFLTVVFVLLTALIKKLGAESIGINIWFNNLLGGVNEQCYEISKYMGYVAFLVLGIFALIGLIQLIKRKSLLKVDKEIFGMGILYLVTLAFYFTSTHIMINLRPAIAPGETVLEPSYPSSHTVMGVVICFSTLLVIEKYLKGALLPIAKAFLGFLMAMIIFNRAMSGTHWLTDIIGGVIFACTLVAWFYAIFCEPKDVLDKPNSGGKHYKKLSR